MPALLLVLAVLLAPVLSAAEPATTRTWDDVPRDVYIDGRLDRDVQTLVSSEPSRMFAFVCGEEVVLFDPNSKEVSRAPRSAFTFAADRVTASSEKTLPATPGGDGIRPNPQTMFLPAVNGKSMLVVSHVSKAGAMTVEELWQTMPVWKAIADSYEPDTATIERLRAIQAPMTLQVVLATWCGDSKRHVPRLLKALALANNPNVTVELMGIGPDFESPMEFVQGANITNVPTVIVKRNGSEIGRYVETPAGATVESDVADIAFGTPKPHPGRITRRNLLASGTYALRDRSGRSTGTETFELYDNESGGLVAHSVIARGAGESIETWTSLDAERKPQSAEVTHRLNGRATRTRYFRNGTNWGGHSRGADGGIVDQLVTMPAWLVTPATITHAFVREGEGYVAAESGVGAFAKSSSRVAKMRTANVPEQVVFADGSTRTLVALR